MSKIKGANNIHGFKLPAFNVEALADAKGKDAEFLADQTGKFPFHCHLHPAHVGGNVTVEE